MSARCHVWCATIRLMRQPWRSWDVKQWFLFAMETVVLTGALLLVAAFEGLPTPIQVAAHAVAAVIFLVGVVVTVGWARAQAAKREIPDCRTLNARICRVEVGYASPTAMHGFRRGVGCQAQYMRS